MQLEEAIKGRRSIRAYKAVPIPKQTLASIIEVAIQTGSSTNMQGWSFEVIGGKALDELRDAMSERTGSGGTANTEVPMYVAEGIYVQRRSRALENMYHALGIGRDDTEKRLSWYTNADRFFEAPNLIVVCLERSLAPWALMDIGMIMDAIMLLAYGYGLGTCAMARAVQYPDILRKSLNIPENKLIAIGIAIGYPDPDAPVNRFRREREPVDSFVTWHGM